MRTLIIDNYDSFTYNLFQLVGVVNGCLPLVVRNDVAWSEIEQLSFDNIIISPGPGRPERSRDFGVSLEAIKRAHVPVLGVCLGHQGIAQAYGGIIRHAPEVMHGRISKVYHAQSDTSLERSAMFADIASPFEVVRYHSLEVAPELPPELEPLAWTETGVLMALRHRTRPLWGVQFHPESICTQYGAQLLANFRDFTRRLSATRDSRPALLHGRDRAASTVPSGRPRPAPSQGAALRWRRVEWCDPEAAFVSLFEGSSSAFWLDSSLHDLALARFSFMGDASGPLAMRLSYDVATGVTSVVERDREVALHESIFEVARRILAERNVGEAELPFDFQCGFVGYFGYELKSECGGDAVHRSPHPDAQLLFADRLLAFDHHDETVYALAFVDEGTAASGEAWLAEIDSRLAAVAAVEPELEPQPEPEDDLFVRSAEQYLADIAVCQQAIADGESYEVCLTNHIAMSDVEVDALSLHRVLRRDNPAPYAAFLRFRDLEVVSSSPERFLRVDRERVVESKPIKGTRPRGTTPERDRALCEELAASEKDRAENLMIVDLLRNDLGIVCEIGSVHVPRLMQVESYATVHQLVSTVAGRLRDDVDVIGCLKAAFPGGSMTGAPKRRTMQIIDALEGRARGVYSGAIGYLGCNGTADLSIVIRTVVVSPSGVSVGTGGAIVALSDPESELRELQVKAQAPMRAVRRVAKRRSQVSD